MGWERKRNDRQYYYRTRRMGRHTFKEYVGSGPVALLAAQLDAEERRQRQAEREAWQTEQVQLAAAERALRDFQAQADLVVEATLILAGFYLHHGEWRRRRARTNHSSTD